MTAPTPVQGKCDVESRRNGSSFFLLCTLVILVFGLILLVLGLQSWHSWQVQSLLQDVSELREKLDAVESQQSLQRSKRQVEPNNLNEDGLPIRQGSYSRQDDQIGDTEGLRIYDAWFQHRSAHEIPKSRTTTSSLRNSVEQENSDPIKPYHRTSASWVEKKSGSSHDLNAHFDDKVFRDPYPSRKKAAGRRSGQAIDLPQTNFYKITPTEQPQQQDSTTPRNVIVSQLPIQRSIYRQNATRPLHSNRNLRRSFPKRNHKKEMRHLEVNDDFEGLKAVHYVGEMGNKLHDSRTYEGEHNQVNQDGVFRNWAPARWVTRMRAFQDFPMDDEGRLSVKKSGLYYIYAQVNYLDEHDVNAFQVYINEDPYLLCTTMTHTRHPTTKANTCFTSAVAFLEAEDQILIRDLEPMRNSIIRPAHTFFGLIQLSTA